MHPSIHAETQPDKPAIVMAASGEALTFAELGARLNEAAQFFRSKGFRGGDTIALCMDNRIDYLPLIRGAQHSSLIYVSLSNRLNAPEIDYIIAGSGAKACWAEWNGALDAMPSTLIADERADTGMLYSSGTTGRPKRVRLLLPEQDEIAGEDRVMLMAREAFGLSKDSIYLCPAPMYHAAHLRWTMAVTRLAPPPSCSSNSTPRTRSPRSISTGSPTVRGCRSTSSACLSCQRRPGSASWSRASGPRSTRPRRSRCRSSARSKLSSLVLG
jgi:acyl-CoA synthetase (AMP-forming)/AMP-acid ligase II